MHFLLFYDYVSDYEALRDQYRAEHLRLAWSAHQRGELELGGAYSDTHDGAVLWFSGADPGVAERFAVADPYVKNGLVKSWRIREWTTVAGVDAATPVKP
jgi:uncharacterized protein YciI